jgi:hypothetical protein
MLLISSWEVSNRENKMVVLELITDYKFEIKEEENDESRYGYVTNLSIFSIMLCCFEILFPVFSCFSRFFPPFSRYATEKVWNTREKGLQALPLGARTGPKKNSFRG